MFRRLYIELLDLHPIFHSKFFEWNTEKAKQDNNQCLRIEQADLKDRQSDLIDKNMHFIDFHGNDLHVLEREKYCSGIIAITPEHQILVVRGTDFRIFDFPNGHVSSKDQRLSVSASNNFFDITGIKLLPTKSNSFTRRFGKQYYYVMCVSLIKFKPIHKGKEIALIQINEIPVLKNMSQSLLDFYKSQKEHQSKL